MAVGGGDTVVARLDAGAPGEPTSPLAREVREAGRFEDQPVSQHSPTGPQDPTPLVPPSLIAASPDLTSYLATASNHVAPEASSIAFSLPYRIASSGLPPGTSVPVGMDDNPAATAGPMSSAPDEPSVVVLARWD